MKKLFLTLLLVLCVFPSLVFADTIDSIDTTAKIQDDGSLNITQVWHATPDSGTEFYIPLNNLNHMELVEFTVSDENGPYTLMQPWNIDASFKAKAGKYGINYTSEGLELCFGKTEMKPKTYILNYTYKNALIGYTDADAFNIRFVNDMMNPAPKSVSLVIEKDGTELNAENARIWAFGYDGNIEFENGKIVASASNFGYSNHLTAMIALNKGLINPSYTVSQSFEVMKNTAFENSSYSPDYTNGDSNNIGNIAQNNKSSFPFFIFSAPLLFFVVIIVVMISSFSNSVAKNFKDVDKKSPEYWRDSIFDSYLPAIYYIKQLDTKILEQYISSVLLRWIGNNDIMIEKREKPEGFMKLFASDVPVLEIKNTPEYEGDTDHTLFNYIILAKGDDSILTAKEFKKFLLKDGQSLSFLDDSAKREGKEYLIKNGYLEKRGKHYYLTESGLKESAKVYAFERFVKDFTLINEREPVEVALWDNILITATLLGLGDEVLKQFKEFYPDYSFASSGSPGDIYLNYMFLNSFANHAHHSAVQSQNSLGCGGGASFGGGGGFSGGGSGGGGR